MSSKWGALTYSASTPTNTSVSVKMRTSNNSDMSGATAFSSCTAISSGSDISSNSCVTDGQRYVQYQLTLSETGGVETAVFNDLSLTFSQASLDPVLDSPGNSSYTNSERPTFKWKAGSEGNSLLSSYSLELDNGDGSTGSPQGSGDFSLQDIPANRQEEYNTSKYKAIYENFGDGVYTNNYITVTSKSTKDWGTDNNDGKLKEGKRSWTVKAKDNTGVEYSSSRTIFVDLTGPGTELTQINETKYSSNGFTTNDKTPTIYGKITDSLSSEIASGPKTVEIKIEKKNNYGFYDLQTLATVNLNESNWTSDGSKVTDNSKNTAGKYSAFSFTPATELPLGNYRVILIGKDNVENSGGSTSFFLNITTLSKITTFEEKEVIEEQTKDLTPEEKEKITNELVITKVYEPPKPSVLSSVIASISEAISQSIRTAALAAYGGLLAMTNSIKQGSAVTISVIVNVNETISQSIGIAASAIGNGLLAMTNSSGQGLAYAGEKISQGTAILGQNINITAKSASNAAYAIGKGYNQLANNAPGAAKTILTRIGNGVSTITTSAIANTVNMATTTASKAIQKIGQTISSNNEMIKITTISIVQNITSAIGHVSQKTGSVLGSAISNTSFAIGEKTQTVSEKVGFGFVKFGYLFINEPTTISDVAVAVLSPTSAKIFWKTNHPANGKVNYGLDETYPLDVQSEKRVKDHEFTLTNLKPDTEYHFEVMSHNNNYVYDANRTFKTQGE